MTTLDKTFSIPEHLQLEMMMDCAGITDHQQQLARLAATKPLTLEKMCLMKFAAICFEVAQRESTFHVVVNVSREQK